MIYCCLYATRPSLGSYQVPDELWSDSNRSVPLGLILPEVRLSKVFSERNLREGERLLSDIHF